MPILVTCPGCKAQFNVHEKFAGKQGPCPKCKAVITIPKPAAAPAAAAATATAPRKGGAPAAPAAPAGPPPEVKIHAPEELQKADKSKTGRPNSKPIFHKDVRLTWKHWAGLGGAVAALFIFAWFAGGLARSPLPLTTYELNDPELVSARSTKLLFAYTLRVVGLLLIGFPVVMAGYAFLYDDELEPYRGRSLIYRALLCLVGYVGVWGLYALIPADLKAEGYLWIFFAPALIVPAAAVAYFCFDLDYVGATIHACFFLIVTFLLGWTAGLQMPWSPPRESLIVPTTGDKIELEFDTPGTAKPRSIATGTN